MDSTQKITSVPPATSLPIPTGYTKFILQFIGHSQPMQTTNKYVKYSPILSTLENPGSMVFELADGMILNVINPSDFLQTVSISYISYNIKNNKIVFNSGYINSSYAKCGESLASLWPYIAPTVTAIFFN